MRYIKIFFAGAILIFCVNPLFSQIKFEDVTREAGLYEPLKGMAGHCAVWGDVNNDGYPDLFFGNFTHFYDTVYNKREHTTGVQPNKFFMNQGDGTFKEVTDSPVRIRGMNSGGAFADFDNDGDLDLVISNQARLRRAGGDLPQGGLARNYLFENDGNGNLTDVTAASGLDFGYPFLGRSTFVFDYDGDGLLDILMQADRILGDISDGNSRLMKNMGGLRFKDVTAEAGLPTGFHTGLHGLGGFVGDINGDTWPDIFFAHSCRMFINNGDGTFHEKEYDFVEEIFKGPAPENQRWTCAADIGDLNNDGKMDFVLGDHLSDTTFHRMYVFMNEGNDENGDPIFREIADEVGIPHFDGRMIHIQLEDVDNDGMVDILTSRYNCFVYRNTGVKDGLPTFEGPISSDIHTGGIGYWAGGSFCDYDRDGRIDFFGPEWTPNAHSPLLRNVTPGAENYIDIRLDLKDAPNRNGIGARVEIYKKGMSGRKEGLLYNSILSVANGYSSGSEPISHIGLPHDKKVDVRVIMPCDGPVIEAKGLKRNRMHVITK